MFLQSVPYIIINHLVTFTIYIAIIGLLSRGLRVFSSTRRVFDRLIYFWRDMQISILCIVFPLDKFPLYCGGRCRNTPLSANSTLHMWGLLAGYRKAVLQLHALVGGSALIAELFISIFSPFIPRQQKGRWQRTFSPISVRRLRLNFIWYTL